MRISGINSVQNIMDKIRMHRSSQFQRPEAKLPATTTPQVAKITTSAMDAVRTLKNESFNPNFTQDQSSASLLISGKRSINLLSQPDAVAKEMLQNLKDSMSLSGDSNRDITLPEHNMSASAFSVFDEDRWNSRFILLDEDTDFAPLRPPTDPQSLPPPKGVPPPLPPLLNNFTMQSSFVPRKTTIESPFLEILPDRIATTNRPSDLPPLILPADIHITSSPDEMKQLDDREVEIESSVTMRETQRWAEEQSIIKVSREQYIHKSEEQDPLKKLIRQRNIGEQYKETPTTPFPAYDNTTSLDIASVLATSLM